MYAWVMRQGAGGALDQASAYFAALQTFLDLGLYVCSWFECSL